MVPLCYGNAGGPGCALIWFVCADEMAHLPSSGAGPNTPRAIPGSIEQVEHDYIRHGTVNILNFLIVLAERWRRFAWNPTTPSTTLQL